MKYYTLETLITENASYHQKHTVTQSDVDKVNFTIGMIHSSRTPDEPASGDVLEYTNQYGEYFPYAHIEKISEESLNICERGTEPWISFDDKGTVYTQMSGGPWAKVERQNPESPIVFRRTTPKAFIIWGHSGPCANGALTFYANVHLWENIVPGLEFTTKTHDKMYLTTSNGKEGDTNEYLYMVENRTNHFAFKTEEEYRLWLDTFNGVERPSAFSEQTIIWAEEHERHCVPLETYLDMLYDVIDTELFNGSVQECKRIYSQGRVITYIPYQRDAIKTPGELPYRHARSKIKI